MLSENDEITTRTRLGCRKGKWEGKGKWACRDDIQTAFTPTCQNVIKIALKHHADIAPWQQNKCSATFDTFGSNRSLFIETAITPNKPVRIGRKEIGPSYNDYCCLCGLCFNVQYGNTGRNIGFEEMFKPQEISYGVLQLFTVQFCSEQ